MQDKIREELKQIRIAITGLLGTSDLPPGEQFSREAIKKALQKLATDLKKRKVAGMIT